MLASKPSISEQSDCSLPDNIFAGLSFPEVPTTILQKSTIDYSSISFPEVPNTYVISSSKEAPEKTHQAQSNPVLAQNKIELVRLKENISKPDTSSLAKLYALEQSPVLATEKMYPSLPSMVPYDKKMQNVINQNFNHTLYDEKGELEMTNEYSSLLGDKSNLISNTGQPKHPKWLIHEPLPQVVSAPNQENSHLINELIRENERLAREVQILKQAQQQQPQSQTQADHGSHALDHASTEMSPQTQLALSNTALAFRPPQLGKNKYVCCGQCRHWLLVAVDKNLVACPQCDAVNNCSLPEPTDATAAAAPAPAPAESTLSAIGQQLWGSFGDCMRGVL